MPENKEFQEDIPTQIANLERKLNEQQDAQVMLRDDLTGQIKDQQEQIAHRILETDKILTQYKLDIQKFNKAMTALTTSEKLFQADIQRQLQEIEKTLTQQQRETQRLDQAMTTLTTNEKLQDAFRESVNSQLHKLDEQLRAQKKLLNDLTEQAKRQQEETDRHLQDINEKLKQHQQDIQKLNQAMTAVSVQQQQAALQEQKRKKRSEWRGWLNLVIAAFIPLAIFCFSVNQQDTALQIADRQNREAVLAAYQSSITELVLNHDLSLASMNLQDQEARVSAQSLTLVTLPRLNANPNINANPDLAGELKGSLIKFLYNAHLINQGRPIISLDSADLSEINLSGNNLELRGINLSGADMTGANLSGADLTQAYLSGTILRGAMLKNTNLSGAYLWNAKLDENQLNGKMQKTDLSGANLSNADLSNADLSNANWSQAVLTGGTRFCHTIGTGIKDSTQTACPRIPEFDRKPVNIHTPNLEDTLARWSFFIEKQQVYNVANIPVMPSLSYDNAGNPLQISLLGEKQYTNVQAYRSLTLANNDEQFDLSLSFYITQFQVSEILPIQALEFTLSWGSGPPYSKAILQWQQIGDGGKNQGVPPNWRVGPVPLQSSKEDSRDSWINLNQPQPLNVGQWYTLDLQGMIVGDQLHLLRFSSMNDLGTSTVGKAFDQPFTFSPLQDPQTQNPKKDVVNIGIQLDGNAHDDQYDVFIDRVNFIECPLNASSCP